MNIVTSNAGAEIVSSTYWDSPHDRAGRLWCSINAGCIRVLVPASQRQIIADMSAAEYCILSRSPWPAMRAGTAFELLFEDRTDTPFMAHLTPDSFDLVPAEPPEGRQWSLSVWELVDGKPVRRALMPCYYRYAPSLPWGMGL
jgi:hypothetical protein